MKSIEPSYHPLLELQDVRKWFPVNKNFITSLFGQSHSYVRAVDGVSLQIGSGEILGLVGESGSGKSTMGELIVRLQEITEGTIYFEGEDISKLRGSAMKRFRRNAQVIFQDPYATLNPRFSIYRAVVEPLVVHGVRDKQERLERVRLALSRAGLRTDEEFLNTFPHLLSGGQRQRVAIARAIVLEPKLLVADEPVSMLDVSIRSGILNLLAELRDTLGISILFISHDLSTVHYLCDRVAIMYLGRIMEIGPAKKVIGHAHHPYSRALLNAVPVVDPDTRRERPEVEGDPPSSITIPSGCRFAPRCPFMTDECIDPEPILEELAPGHWVRCIHPRFEPLWPITDKQESERINQYA
jgi:peptide/nickel transport system ATP-binding protein